MSRHHLGFLGNVPLEHIGVNSGRAARKAQICYTQTVALHISRTVARAEHISILTNCRTDISLAELYQNFGLNGLQTTRNALHQHIYRLRDALDIATGIELCHRGILALQTERVDKVQLKTVEIPLAQSLLVD